MAIDRPEGSIRQFVASNVRSGKPTLTDEILAALDRANDRYVRYRLAAKKWKRYGERKKTLKKTQEACETISMNIKTIDPITYDKLLLSLGREGMQILRESIDSLEISCFDLIKEIEKTQNRGGRSIDLAYARWIYDVKDIYDQYFRKTANLGKFYELLRLNVPNDENVRKNTPLDPRQIKRVLVRRVEATTSHG